MAKTYSAISLHGGMLRYLALTGSPGNLSVVRSVELHIERDFSNLAVIISSINAQLSKAGVVFGVPVRECMVRLVEYPRMPLSDAKQALQFDFDKYFTWSYSESSVDVCEVESPVLLTQDKMPMLVAVCRNELVTLIIDATEKVRMRVSAIEPMSVAMLRSIIGYQSARSGVWYSFHGEYDCVHFALVYKDNGLFYRSSTPVYGALDFSSEDGILAVMTEVQKTMTFVGNQFKGISPEIIVLTGTLANNEAMSAAIENTTSLKTESLDIYAQWGIKETNMIGSGYESALGLCMRDAL